MPTRNCGIVERIREPELTQAVCVNGKGYRIEAKGRCQRMASFSCICRGESLCGMA